MLSDIEPYLDFEQRILYRTGVLRRASMRISLCRTFEEMSGHYADMMIEALQYHGGVLISEDGWLITKGCYKRITGDREFSLLRSGSKERIPAGVLEIEDERDRAIADCMVIAADIPPGTGTSSSSCRRKRISRLCSFRSRRFRKGRSLRWRSC